MIKIEFVGVLSLLLFIIRKVCVMKIRRKIIQSTMKNIIDHCNPFCKSPGINASSTI